MTYTDYSRRRRYMETLLDTYWKRFNSDYLYQLQEHHKYSSKRAGKDRLIVGDVVIIKEDDMLPRGRWKKGIITRLIAGKDGYARGAAIKCIVNNKSTEYERPIQKVIPFELVPDSSLDDNTFDDSSSKTFEPNIIIGTHPLTKVRRRAAIVGEIQRRRENHS